MDRVNAFEFWIAHATFLDWVTNISGLLAVVVLGLVIYGFRRYINRPRMAPIDYIGTGIWIICLATISRFIWWDVVPDITGFAWRTVAIQSYTVNWIFNLGVLTGGIYILKGFYLIVDAQAPGQYSIWTAVFYPKRLRLWLDSNAVEDDNE